jgi:hypothetical protein
MERAVAIGFVWAFVAGALAGCEVAASPGTPTNSTAGQSAPGAPSTYGSVSLALSLPGGTALDQIGYAITGPTIQSGTVDVSHAQNSIVFVLGPLQAGTGYSLVLTATDTEGDSCISAPTPFEILSGITTPLSTNLVCTVGDGAISFADAGTGSLEVDASVTVVYDPSTVCPTVAGIAVTPAEEVVGATSAVSVVTAPAGAAVSYTVTATDPAGLGDGTVSNATATSATFTCTSAGQVRLTASTTAPLNNDSGSCPPQSMSALINCEPGFPDSCLNAAVIAAPIINGPVSFQFHGNTCDSNGSAPVPPSSCPSEILGKPLYYLFQYGNPNNIVYYHFDLTPGFDTFFLRADCLEVGYCPTPGSFDLATSYGAFTDMIVVARPDGSCGAFTLTISAAIP